MSEVKQYLVAKIEKEKYAFDISTVQEIMREVTITKVPNKLFALEGVFCIRNKVVPLINLRQKLYQGLKIGEHYTVILIYLDQNPSKLVGLIVDEANEVIMLPDSLIDKPFLMNAGQSDKMITGVGKLDSGLVIVLNPDFLFTDEEKIILEKTKKSGEKKLGKT